MDKIRKIFLVVLFLIPFFQGLYFLHESYFFNLFMLVLLIVMISIKKELVLEKNMNLMFFGILALLYFISSTYAVDKGMALLGGFKYLTYVIFFILFIQLDCTNFREKALTSISISMVLTALLGIISFYIQPLEELLIQENRLGGTLQYANTFALLCTVSLLWLMSKNKGVWYSIGMGIIFAGIVLTFSRSVLILCILAVVVSIILNKGKRLWQLVPLMLGGLLAYFIIYERQLSEISARYAQTTTSASEWVTRMVYYKDALNMIKHFPFGTGYLGCYYIQRTFQTSAIYFVKYVHNHLLQVILDIGLIGGVLWATFFISNIFSKRMGLNSKLILTVIFAHALIDFDFEFPVVIVFIILLLPLKQEKIILSIRKQYHHFLVLTGLALIFSYFTVVTYLSYYNNHQLASNLYPLFTDAQVEILKNEPDFTYENWQMSQNLIKRNEYLVEAYVYQQNIYYKDNQYAHAIESAQSVMKCNPLNIKHVEIYSDILLKYTKDAIDSEQIELAKASLVELMQIDEYLERLAKERVTDYNIRHAPQLQMTEKLLENDREARLLYETYME